MALRFGPLLSSSKRTFICCQVASGTKSAKEAESNEARSVERRSKAETLTSKMRPDGFSTTNSKSLLRSTKERNRSSSTRRCARLGSWLLWIEVSPRPSILACSSSGLSGAFFIDTRSQEWGRGGHPGCVHTARLEPAQQRRK